MKKIFLVLVISGIVKIAFAQSVDLEVLTPPDYVLPENGGKMYDGFIRVKARVENTEWEDKKFRWTFLDSSGNELTKANGLGYAKDFYQGFAKVATNSSGVGAGLIDKTGNPVIPLNKYIMLGDSFCNGLILAQRNTYTSVDYILINNKDEIVFPKQKDDDLLVIIGKSVNYSHKNVLRIYGPQGDVKNGLIYYNLAKDISTEPLQEANPFYNGRARVKFDGKYQYLGENLEAIVDATYFFAKDFSQGRAAISSKFQHWAYIDKQGYPLCDYIYTYGSTFENGVAENKLNTKSINGWGIIDTNMQVIIPFEYDGFGFTKESKERNDETVKTKVLFEDGYLIAYQKDAEGIRKMGLLDRNANVKIPFNYKEVISLGEQMYGVKNMGNEGSQYAIFNAEGKQLTDFKYNWILGFHDGYTLARYKKKKKEIWEFIDAQGNITPLPKGFWYAYENDPYIGNGIWVVMHEGDCKWVNTKGEVLLEHKFGLYKWQSGNFVWYRQNYHWGLLKYTVK